MSSSLFLTGLFPSQLKSAPEELQSLRMQVNQQFEIVKAAVLDLQRQQVDV
eukprot:m.77440 g.77440  ORF g.77440 m.77440 type:complete len:51 (+) comp20679_c0_seq1:2974-3126(+)